MLRKARPCLRFSKLPLLALTLLLMQAFTAGARDGMWVPAKLKDREKDMDRLGLQIPIEKIYNEDGTGLNNAVVLFGKGCTGEVISGQGLVLTNHHCAYGSVQGLSSASKDYFANGFWAMSPGDELPCPGLTVTFVRKMENVSTLILRNIPDSISAAERDTIINRRIRAQEKSWADKTKLDASVRSFYSGNQYWVMITETYKDIRLVGFPPNGIGFYGGETDNWMWPRYNGDFSLFRIYADANNKPAGYAAGNKPYKPAQSFTISAKGYKEGDFAMVYGFPAMTQQYITSYQLNEIQNIQDPIRIEARTRKLDSWTKSMDANREVFLKYTSKWAGIANGWKKWQGEVRGLRENNVIAKKEEYERDYLTWASKDSAKKGPATDVLSKIQANTVVLDSLMKGDEYIRECVLGIELIQQAMQLDQWIEKARKGEEIDHEKLVGGVRSFYRNYDVQTDKDLFVALMPLYFDKAGSRWIPEYLNRLRDANRGDYRRWANTLFANSMIASEEKMTSLAAEFSAADTNRIKADAAWQLYNAVHQLQLRRGSDGIAAYNSRLASLNREYLKYRLQKDIDTPMFPDANQTLRISYGQVRGIDPSGPAGYAYQTTLDEMIDKGNSGGPDYQVPEPMKELYNKKVYGKWAVNKTVPIAFTADAHTSGGNSGSPVLNGKGELIGTNFDRVWDGTMSDLYFDPSLSRNISVDIRYTLFVIEKFGKAGWLLKEMKFSGK